MTKTLTEQWREGTLPCGAYYVNRLNEIRVYLVTYENQKNTHEIYEVLAPVPSFDEYKELTRKVENLEWDKKEDDALINFCNKRLVKYHKEIAKLKEQIEEANAIIDLYFPTDKKINSVCVKPINDYRKKWGVK